MSIATAIQNAQTKVAAAYASVTLKGGVIPATEDLSHLPAAIESIPSGGDDEDLKAIKFRDYDGTVVYSYTPAEALELTALPSVPYHADLGLHNGEWNYTLAQVKAMTKGVDVGAIYDSADTYTHIYINLPENGTYHFCFGRCYVDWGDGSSEESNSGISVMTHTYTAGAYEIVLRKYSSSEDIYLVGATKSFIYLNSVGEGNNYVIRVIYGSSTVTSIASNSAGYNYGLSILSIPNSVTSISETAFRYSAMKYVAIPSSVTTIGKNAFLYCVNLKNVSIPASVTSLGQFAFKNCASLESIVLPDIGLTAQQFYNCFRLRKITIYGTSFSQVFSYCNTIDKFIFTDNFTTIGDYAFWYNDGIYEFTVPSTVTTMGKNLFSNMVTLHMKPTTPPTLGSSAITTTYLYRIIVPQGSLSAYRAATNWSTYASYMEEET